jgi:hypothetical protein
MLMGKKKGRLSPSTYFPLKGDVLECVEEGTVFTAMRNHVIVDERTGKKIEYTILIGRCEEEFGDEPLIRTYYKGCRQLARDLEETDSIYRERKGVVTRYDRVATGTFEEA